MKMWIVLAEKLTETSLTVYLSDGSTVEVSLDDLLWLRSQSGTEAQAELNSSKWD